MIKKALISTSLLGAMLMTASSCQENYTDYNDCMRKKMSTFGVKRHYHAECKAMFPVPKLEEQKPASANQQGAVKSPNKN